MRHWKKNIGVIIFLGALAFAQCCFAEQVVFIVNLSNKISSLTTKEIINIYTLRIKTWPSGILVEAVSLPVDNSVRMIFSKSVLCRDPATMEQFYLRKALTGKGQPPRTFKTTEDVKSFVARTKGAIGYILATEVDDSVKVVPVIREQ